VLQLTPDATSQVGFVYLDKAFNASSKIAVNFTIDWLRAAASGNSTGDGMAFMLFDGSVAKPTSTYSTGLLGYQNMLNGYLGFSMDEFNASTANDRFVVYQPTATSTVISPLITKNLSTVSTLGFTDFGGGVRDVSITLENKVLVIKMRNSDATDRGIWSSSATNWVTVVTYDASAISLPDYSTLKLAFAGSNGGAKNTHNIDNLSLSVRDVRFYSEALGEAGTQLDNAWVSFDSDSAAFKCATVTFASGYASGDGVTMLDSLRSIASFSRDTSTGALTVTASTTSGTWTSAEAQSVLSGLRFYSNSTDVTTERNLDITLTDSANAVSSATRLIYQASTVSLATTTVAGATTGNDTFTGTGSVKDQFNITGGSDTVNLFSTADGDVLDLSSMLTTYAPLSTNASLNNLLQYLEVTKSTHTANFAAPSASVTLTGMGTMYGGDVTLDKLLNNNHLVI
jgi:hypothetical protein